MLQLFLSYPSHVTLCSTKTIATSLVSSVPGLAKKVVGHLQGLQLQKVVGPDEKL